MRGARIHIAWWVEPAVLATEDRAFAPTHAARRLRSGSAPREQGSAKGALRIGVRVRIRIRIELWLRLELGFFEARVVELDCAVVDPSARSKSTAATSSSAPRRLTAFC